MNKTIQLELSPGEYHLMLDALKERLDSWRNTQRYLETGDFDADRLVEECADKEEACGIVSDYEQLLERVG